jgi:riboflavin synthase
VFTGIVRERGVVARLEDGRLEIEAPATAGDAEIGDSIAIDGVCLTVVRLDGGRMAFDFVPETARRTSLSRLEIGADVNVEPALRAADRMGGHVVQGHVDAVGRVRSVEAEGEGRRVWFDAPPDIRRLCVEKGSIAVQGVSLTVAELDDAGFAVALVPHTLAETTFGRLARGDEVNFEADVLAKYVERLLSARAGGSADDTITR